MPAGQNADSQSASSYPHNTFDLKPRTRMVVVILCYCGLLLAVGMFDGATRYAPRWWVALGLGSGSVIGFGVGLGVGATVLLGLLYGLIALVQHFESYPFEITIPSYIGAVGLLLVLPILLVLLYGLFWAMRRVGILDDEIK